MISDLKARLCAWIIRNAYIRLRAFNSADGVQIELYAYGDLICRTTVAESGDDDVLGHY